MRQFLPTSRYLTKYRRKDRDATMVRCDGGPFDGHRLHRTHGATLTFTVRQYAGFYDGVCWFPLKEEA